MSRIPLLTMREVAIIAIRTREAMHRIPDMPEARAMLVRLLIEQAELFFGIRPDNSLAVIKRVKRLDLIADATAGACALGIGAMHVAGDDEADELRRLYGDDAPHPRNRARTRIHVIQE